MNPHRTQFMLNHTNSYESRCFEFFAKPIVHTEGSIGDQTFKIAVPAARLRTTPDITIDSRIRLVHESDIDSYYCGFTLWNDDEVRFSTWVGSAELSCKIPTKISETLGNREHGLDGARLVNGYRMKIGSWKT